jgi:hypothetical protein
MLRCKFPASQIDLDDRLAKLKQDQAFYLTLVGRLQGLRHLASAPFAGLGRTRLDQVVRCNCVYVLFSRLPGFLCFGLPLLPGPS